MSSINRKEPEPELEPEYFGSGSDFRRQFNFGSSALGSVSVSATVINDYILHLFLSPSKLHYIDCTAALLYIFIFSPMVIFLPIDDSGTVLNMKFYEQSKSTV
jgi:hypothetical protein